MNETKPQSHEPLNSCPNSPPATISPQVYRIELCLGKGRIIQCLFSSQSDCWQNLFASRVTGIGTGPAPACCAHLQCFSPPITGRYWRAIPESDKFEATTRSRLRIQPPASVHASSAATSNQHARLIPSLAGEVRDLANNRGGTQGILGPPLPGN
jgi:hypothetical protein